MKKILGAKFYCRSAQLVARELLGKYLVVIDGKKIISRMITEVEAYDGPEDLASHASRGRRTKRNEIMYGSGGFWYVYLVYGLHRMLNIVTGEKDYPAAVLIRSVEGVIGPGRVTKFYGLGREFNSQSARKQSGLFIEDRGKQIKPADIKTSARIGVDYAGPVWSRKQYRFFLI